MRIAACGAHLGGLWWAIEATVVHAGALEHAFHFRVGSCDDLGVETHVDKNKELGC
jgi:hypothetical protein